MTEQLKFSKMEGLGNDFMVIDAINQSVNLTPALIQKWSHRQFGVGFDQLLLVEASTKVDFTYRIFNTDGSEVEQCGNGARCFARFVVEKGLTDKSVINVETASGIITLYIVDKGLVKVNMGLPNFSPASLPYLTKNTQDIYAIQFDGSEFKMGLVSMGNPHAILRVNSVESAPVEKLGSWLESHKDFPERVNVGFAEKVDNQHLKLRVYERGAAETLACGTGACAAMVSFRQLGEVGDSVTVSLPGGDLLIEWNGESNSPVWMSGPATMVFEGVINA